MKLNLLQYLCCPDCHSEIDLEALKYSDRNTQEIEEGVFKCTSCCSEFPIIKGIPRFVPQEHYTSNFGFQWNRFRKTQLDSNTNVPLSRDRFFNQSNWRPEELEGALILDAGCGAGRFSEIALSAGATVIAIDASQAVEACFDNLKTHKKLHVIQADIYRLPFKSNLFDYAYLFGVLQHLPDPQKALFELIEKVKSQGKLCIDSYKKDWRVYFWPKYWLRPLTKKLSSDLLLRIVKAAVPILLPISSILGKTPRIGKHLKYVIPVANYEGVYALNKEQLFEWAILDTFDMFSPEYDLPQTAQTIKYWLKETRLINIQVKDCGVIVGQGEKP